MSPTSVPAPASAAAPDNAGVRRDAARAADESKGRVGLMRRSLKKHSSKIIYIALSGVSFGVSFGLTTLLHEIVGLRETVSLIITLVVVMVMNFFALRHLVYKAAEGSIWRQFRGFVMMAVCFRGIEVLAFALAVDVLGFHYQIALVCIQGTMAVCKFLVGDKLVFRTKVGRRLCEMCGRDLDGLPFDVEGLTCLACGDACQQTEE